MIAIFGGTFDPVHVAHLRVAWEAADALGCEVRLMPCHVPPHRPPPLFDSAARVEMLRIALLGQQRLQIDLRELERSGPSYTVDTLIGLRAERGRDEALILLLGADAFAQLSSWHRWRELFDLAHIGVLTRPGHGQTMEAEVAAELFARRVDNAAQLRDRPAGGIVPIAVTALEISASAVRALLLAGRSARYLLPAGVVEFIESRGDPSAGATV